MCAAEQRPRQECTGYEASVTRKQGLHGSLGVEGREDGEELSSKSTPEPWGASGRGVMQPILHLQRPSPLARGGALQLTDSRPVAMLLLSSKRAVGSLTKWVVTERSQSI